MKVNLLVRGNKMETYKCKYCEKTYYMKSSLNEHYKSNHKKQLEEDKIKEENNIIENKEIISNVEQQIQEQNVNETIEELNNLIDNSQENIENKEEDIYVDLSEVINIEQVDEGDNMEKKEGIIKRIFKKEDDKKIEELKQSLIKLVPKENRQEVIIRFVTDDCRHQSELNAILTDFMSNRGIDVKEFTWRELENKIQSQSFTPLNTNNIQGGLL